MSADLPAKPPSENGVATRRTLRRALIERRLALSATEWKRLSAIVCERLGASFPELAARRVGFCWPVHNEPDLRPLIEAWRNAGRPGFAALLPVVIAPEAPLAFRAWTAQSRMAADRYGIAAPLDGEFLTPQALLLPLNAFDAAGYRLGYGGGFFDRTLAALSPPPLAIGVGFELARIESIVPEAHDVRLDAIVTEAGIFWPDQEER